MEPQESQKAWCQVVARAWSDGAFKDRLLRDPMAALKESGIEPPADVTFKVVENSAKVMHLVLPEPPSSVEELSDAELDQVAGGLGTRLNPNGFGACMRLDATASKIITPGT
jgi:hypothetical protein